MAVKSEQTHKPKRGRRRYAYRGGSVVEITAEIENPPRYPYIKVLGLRDRHWNHPK